MLGVALHHYGISSRVLLKDRSSFIEQVSVGDLIMTKPKSNEEAKQADELAEDLSAADNVEQEENNVAEIELSEEAAQLVNDLHTQINDAVAARQRALADFHNYQKRAAESEIRANIAGSAKIARSLLAVIDHFDMAINQDTTQLSTEQLLSGIRLVKDELVKALGSHGVNSFEPAIGDEFDPMTNEAMMHQPSEDIEANHIVSVLQVGYKMGDLVLRPAKVSIAAPADKGE